MTRRYSDDPAVTQSGAFIGASQGRGTTKLCAGFWLKLAPWPGLGSAPGFDPWLAGPAWSRLPSVPAMSLGQLEPSISIRVLRTLVQGGSVAGISWDDLVAAGAKTLGTIDPAQLDDPDARVTARAALELWELLPRLTGNDAFGLWLAEIAGATPANLHLWFVLSSSTLDQGLDEVVRFQQLLHDRAYSKLERSDQETTYVHRFENESFRVPRHAVEFGFAHLVSVMRRATGLDVMPSRVSFQHARPASALAHARLFGEGVEFGAERNSITFARATLDLEVRTADPALGEIVAAHSRLLLRALPDNSTWTARVQWALGERKLRETCDIEAIATSFSMAKRSLQRRLQDEGTTFEEIVDGLRREFAEHCLRERRLSTQETAFMLGYSDVPAFHRAFVRWTGLTPKTFRQQDD